MFILEAPFVSDYLAEQVRRLGAPVLDTAKAREALGADHPLLTNSDAFERLVRDTPGARVYSNSENAVAWVADRLAGTPVADAVAVFKDKVAYREALATLHPDFGFAGVDAGSLASFDPSHLRFPVVIKPAVGFFSLGVRIVSDPAEWAEAVSEVAAQASRASAYPDSVVGRDRFIIEEVIEGEEFAVDAYFDSRGDVVVLNVMAHRFASADDVSDRVYVTSREIVERWRGPLGEYLGTVGETLGVRDFPIHAELRVGTTGDINAIEINPLRFGGWCVGDMAHFAWGFDPYEAYLRDERPDWDAAFAARGDVMTAVVVADIPRVLRDDERVDYDAFLSGFSRPLDLRRTDAHEYTVFAFLFAEVPADDGRDLDAVLGADLMRYVVPDAS